MNDRPVSPSQLSPPSNAAAASTGYRDRVLTAVKWSASGELGFQAIRFFFGIALARLLSPADFGLMAMLMVFVTFVVGNADLGFEEAIIQKRDIAQVHYASVFWGTLVSALVLMAGLMAAAPWIAGFYDVPALSMIARLLSVLFVLRALGTVPRALIARRLDFRLAASRRCLAIGLAGVCAVTLAWRGFGVISLVAESLVATGMETLLFFGASRWRPTRELRLAALRDLFGFSAYRPAARILNYWAVRIDQLLIGKLLGSTELGLYVRAFNLGRFPVMSTSRVIVDVLFPSLSLIQDDTRRVRRVYLRATGAIALVAVPMCMGLCAAAEPFVLGVLGPQWREAIPILRILAVTGLFQSFSVFATSVYLSQGRTSLLLRLTIGQRALMIAAIVTALHWGVRGVAIAQLLSAVLMALPMLYFAGGLIELPLRVVLDYLSRVFLAGTAMMLLVYALDRSATARVAPLALLGAEVLSGIVVYWAALWLLRADAYRDVVGILARRGAAGSAPISR